MLTSQSIDRKRCEDHAPRVLLRPISLSAGAECAASGRTLDALFAPAGRVGRGRRQPRHRSMFPHTSSLLPFRPRRPGHEFQAKIGSGARAAGGWASSFRARHHGSQRVIRRLNSYAADSTRARTSAAGFQREAEAVLAARHPNVVQIHDGRDSDGRAVLVSSIALWSSGVGGSLAQKLAGTPQPVGGQPPRYLAPCPLPSRAAHQAIVHRDLKRPANLLYRRRYPPISSTSDLVTAADSSAQAFTRAPVTVGIWTELRRAGMRSRSSFLVSTLTWPPAQSACLAKQTRRDPPRNVYVAGGQSAIILAVHARPPFHAERRRNRVGS